MVPEWVKKLGPIATRLAVGHFASYPPSLVWTVSLMPLVLRFGFTPAQLAAMSEKAAGRTVTYHALALGGGMFVIVHLLSLPWAFSKTDEIAKRRQRGFFIAVGVTLVLGVLVGAGTWGHLIFFMK